MNVVFVGQVMFCVCGVHGSDKLCLKLAVCLREIYDFCQLLKWMGDRECKLFPPRVMSVDIFYIQLACLTLRFMLHLIQHNTLFFLAKNTFVLSKFYLFTN
jgi:hypothetical protein